MMDDATDERHDGSESPTHAPLEASAFVLSLLSGTDHQGVNRENDPSPISMAGSLVGASEPVPAESESIPSTRASDVVRVGGDESVDSRSANGPAAKRYSKINVPLMIVSLGMLTVGSGLAIGYGLFGGGTKPQRKSLAEEGRRVAVYAAGTKTDHPPEAAVNANASGMKPPVSSAKMIAPSPRDNDLQKSVAQMSSGGSKRDQAIDAGRAPANFSISHNDSLSVKPNSEQSATILEPSADMPLSHPGSAAEKLTRAGISARFSNDEAGATDLMRPTNLPPTITTSGITGTTSLAVDQTGADARPAANKSLGELRPPVVAIGQIDPCQLVHFVRPMYPSDAKKLHVEGNVELRVVVGADGTVGKVSLVSGLPLLAPAAIDAARQFRYKPAMLNGQPIETMQTIDMSFKLEN